MPLLTLMSPPRKTPITDFTAPDNETLPYRPCVGIALFNNCGEVFVGERIDTPGAWQMPQGGIDAGEDIAQAAQRELREEIGTNHIEVIRISSQTTRYDLPPELQRKFWNGQFRGQEQFWVAARFLGQDSDINLNAHHPPEFQNWQWVSLENTLDLIVPFKRDVYTQIIAMFGDIAAT